MIGNYIGTVCVGDIELVEQHLARTHPSDDDDDGGESSSRPR